jgi:hypothetical protein
MVSPQSCNAAHTSLYSKACSTFSLAGGVEGFSLTSISPEGSVTVDEVSTINTSGVSGPEKNGAVYIRPRGSSRGIPSSSWAAGHVRTKISAYTSNCHKEGRLGLMARRTCMKSSRLQWVRTSHGWEGSTGGMKASPKFL